MKRAILTAAVALSVAAPQARAANVEFNGRFHATAANATCVSLGDVPSPLSFRFRPPNLGDNGPTTSLSIFYDFGAAENYALASGSLVGTTFKAVTVTVVGGRGGQGSATMRIRSQVPAAPTDTTTKISIAGDIKTFSGDAGCNLSFVATGYLK